MRTKSDNAIVQTAIAILKRETAHGAQCWPRDAEGLQPMLDALRLEYGALDREHSGAIFLDHRGKLLGCECIAIGTSTSVPIYMRDLVRAALGCNATGAILWHTHPGGDSTPSQEDLKATVHAVDFLAALEITVHDHFVLSTNGCSSIREIMEKGKKS